ncbi:MAG: AgmX/PglI C-terminal domain-containing protein, partial [Myxococcota bacterium]
AEREQREREKKEKAEQEKQARFVAAAEEPKEEPKKEAKKPRASDCDPILYPEGCDDKQKAAAKKTAAAGGKETLSKADILGVVKKNKGDISRCVAEQKKKDASKAEGVLKMTWVVKNDGRTASVGVESEEFASAYVGKCITRAIQGWKFDAYTGDEIKPIKFPFKLDQFAE